MTLPIRDDVPLAPLTTLELGGRARHLVTAPDEAAIVEAFRWAEARKLPVLVLGGGSNVVIADEGFPGLVVQIASRGLEMGDGDAGQTIVTAAAGEPWDPLVAETVVRGLGGLECLSGIPGLAGATPIQNVGAYGQEVAETIQAVRVLERQTWRVIELSPAECRFGYRDSAFKHDPERFVVLAVRFLLRKGGEPAVRYRELAEALGRTEPALADVRRAVLALRRKKSMVIDAGDPNRRSVGSFFTNPVVGEREAEAVAARAVELGAIDEAEALPRWPAASDLVKLSAAWLIERAGFKKGMRRGAFGLSTAHSLALVHHGGGSTAALLDFAREVRDAVRARFGIELTPEPTLIGASWNTSEN